jgi:hypothetical protein
VDGTLLWSAAMPGYLQVAPILAADGRIYVCTWRFVIALQPAAPVPVLSVQDVASIAGGGTVLLTILVAVACVCYRERRPRYVAVTDGAAEELVVTDSEARD